MNIQQLRYVRAVLCTGSFSGAARVEQVSVQAVSKGLGELEAELGQTLFIRGSKGADPTPFCQGIKPLIQGALDRVGRIEGFAKNCDVAVSKSHSGLKVLIAAPHFNNWQGVCTGLEQFLGRQLGMRVSLGISVGNAALGQLYDDSIDAFITVGAYENPACDSVTVGTLPAGVFCPKSHPLFGKGSVTIADLAPYPTGYVIGLDDFNETLVNIYRKHGMKSAIVPVATGEEYERLLSEENGFAMGVGIEAFSSSPEWGMLRFKASDALAIPVCAITLKDHKTECYRAFERFMLEEFSHLMGVVGS
ncbi:LysR family transcriptional regulator [Enorma phocaeensis]|uniref:LysR family transcriptional regulator n=1 Tax=Enorma phocaeensis TaxID=1871019 RepID=A0A921LTN6_9ACTN|nr:LysR family transcriptional regulator [Enorma phocaeensis]